ncbi:MAG: stage V sporulation protein AB [Lachnospiraceae bacterium]|nr:stage V sporulation protein AB [Lachnospiraceae bacterium]
MIWQQIFFAVIGVSGGVLVSAGVFTVLLAVGLVPRFAGKTHTADHIFLYEEMVVLGTLTGIYFSVFENIGNVGEFIRSRLLFGEYTIRIWQIIADIFLAAFGMFAGVFVGCLALAIAEMLDSIPILTRRIGFRHGLGMIVLATALGKMVGSFIYYVASVWEAGL